MISHLEHAPAYRLQSSRLLLRCWAPEDAEAMKRAVDESLAHLRPWMPWAWEEPKSLIERVQWLRQARSAFDRDQDYFYGLFDRQSGEVVGGAGLHRRLGEFGLEVGYWLHAAHTGRGLATEATAALTQVAFELHGVERLEIRMDTRNRASAAIPPRLGFSLEGTIRHRETDLEGQHPQVEVWRLLAYQYPMSPAAHLPLEAWNARGARVIPLPEEALPPSREKEAEFGSPTPVGYGAETPLSRP